MIPILFEQSERDFNSGGLGFLVDCTSCIVTEERNGVYECEFQYPITGSKYSLIQEKRIIFATHDDSKIPQPFDIYARSAPINGVVTFYAHHISYRLSNAVVMPFEANSVANAMSKISARTVTTSDFTFATDKTTSGPYSVTAPSIVRNVLGGEEGSLLDVYGKGDYEFDKFSVFLHTSRGIDTDVEIRYGKNLIEIEHNIDESDSYNAIVPFWLGETETEGEEEPTPILVTLPEGYVSHDDGTNYIVAVPYQMNDEFEGQPTVAQLRTKAQQLIDSSKAWVPSEQITVNFVQLWQTAEYEQFAPLQRVKLCDTLRVYYPELGVDGVKQKVVKTVYNTLLDRYDEITLNQLSQTLSQATQEQILASNESVAAAINLALELIRGNLGGYIAMPTDSNGKPQSILVMDKPSKSTAVNVLKFDKNGLWVSSDGVASTSWVQIYDLASRQFKGFSINGNLSITGGLTVTGNISAASVSATNLSTGGLTVTGSASVGGDLTVTGTIIN